MQFNAHVVLPEDKPLGSQLYWDPPTPLYNVYRIIPAGKAAGA
jgi:hypothetical protein